jgi:hypothetical protein
MPSQSPLVTAYVAKAPDFARPILTHIRKVVHAACPDVEETIKWGCPHFQYHGMLCAMATFKAHCKLGFWRGALVVPTTDKKKASDALRRLDHLTALSDLPPDRVLVSYVKRSMALAAQCVKAPHMANRTPRPALAAPAYLTAAIKRQPRALATWKALAPSHRRDYIEWVTGAKTEPTRARRLATTVEWLAEGKSRNWKYARRA